MGKYVAIDLGASNGRTILGCFDGKRITLEEMNRFENNFVHTGDSYYWDVLYLYASILDGLRISGVKADEISGIGIDTWGVDFGLIDRQGRLVGNPHAYRDPRGLRGMQAFHAKYGERKAFDCTGVANMEFNTVYQLYDAVQSRDPQLEIADKLLLMPDLLGYMLCGVASVEYTHASTTQLLDSKTRFWSKELLEMTGISPSILTNIQMSGEIKGSILPLVAETAGLKNTPPIICVGSHDTASAVASVPAKNDNFAFISSGTWSLIGIVSDHAIINDEVFENNFSNEGTVNGDYRPLRNIMGLWIIQNCRREWLAKENVSWNDIVTKAQEAPAFRSLIDVNAHAFYDGYNMTKKIQEYCKATGQPVPQTMGEIARTVYESLAMSYREAFEGLERLKGRRLDVLHIMGGGAQNRILNQFAANALNREVVAGPYEATAIGNLMMQVKACGEVGSMAEMREVICNSFNVEHYEPQDTEQWAAMYQRFKDIKRKK